MTKRLLIITLSLFAISVNAQNKNLLGPTNWVANTEGTIGTGSYIMQGNAIENKRVFDNTPKGIDVVWKGSNIPSFKPDTQILVDNHGGFISPMVPINTSNTYRFSIWVKRNYSVTSTTYKKLKTSIGFMHHTSVPSTTPCIDISTLTGLTEQPSPFFMSDHLQEVGVWYLIVGYVYKNELVLPALQEDKNRGGVYNGITGEKVSNIASFKFKTNTTNGLAKIRAHFWGTEGNADDFQSYYDPRIEVVDGTEPSIDQLLGKGAQSSFTSTLYPTKLGINTPRNIGGYTLAVNGDMIAKSVRVELTGPWPDYVFENDYKLKSLEEIECFVNENKHLPEVPSSKEVNKEGINLGEMNAKLLRKIEELTLYLINQNKQIKDLQSELEKIKEIK